MGILDGFNDEQSQGLLAAAAQMLQQSGPSLRPTGIGQILGGAYNAYEDSTLATRKRKFEEQAARQAAQMRGLQIQEAQGGLADKQRTRDIQAQIRAALATQDQPAVETQQPAPQGMGSAMPGGPMSPKIGGPDWMQAYQAQSPQGMPALQQRGVGQPQGDTNQALIDRLAREAGIRAKYGDDAGANALYEHIAKLRDEYATDFRVAQGPDGQLHNYLISKTGKLQDTGLGVKPDMTEMDLGGAKQFVDKNRVLAGQQFIKTQSPDSVVSNALGRDRLNFDKSQATSTDDAVMDPLAVRMTAQQYLAGDSGAMANFGRGAQGAANLNAVRLEVAKQANAAGMNGADVAAKMAEFAGLKAGQRTAGVRSASIEIAANEVAQLAPIALDASAKVARSGFLPFGKAQIMFDSNSNNPDMRQFAMANTALVNAYGQAMARGGAATVSDKDHARELLSTTFDQPSYAAAVAQLQKETRAAQAAPKQVRKDLSDSVAGREVTPAAPAPTMPAMPTANASNKGRTIIDHDTGKRYKSNGLQWQEVK